MADVSFPIIEYVPVADMVVVRLEEADDADVEDNDVRVDAEDDEVFGIDVVDDALLLAIPTQ